MKPYHIPTGRTVLTMLAMLVAAEPATAAEPPKSGEQKDEASRQIENAVTQPIADVNLKRKEIPPILAEAQNNPYSLAGIRKCGDVIAGVNALNAVLGPDFDTPVNATVATKRRKAIVNVAGGFIKGLVPFRSIIREISGANKADQEFSEAVYAGLVRRGFLKGYGRSRGCKPPGAPFPVRAKAAAQPEESK